MTREKKLFTVKEVLRIIPMSESGLYIALRKGVVPSLKIGGRVFIPSWYVDNLLKEPCVKTVEN